MSDALLDADALEAAAPGATKLGVTPATWLGGRPAAVRM